MKRKISTALAALSLANGVPFIPGDLDPSPKASARRWGKRQYEIPNPCEMDEMTEAIRSNPYFSENLRSKFTAPVDDEEEFNSWWVTRSREDRLTNGQKWWSYFKSHHEAATYRRSAIPLPSPEEVKKEHDERRAADMLLLRYFDTVANLNGIDTSRNSNEGVVLYSSLDFSNKLNKNFGTFEIIEQDTILGGAISVREPQRVPITASERLIQLLTKRGRKQAELDRQILTGWTSRYSKPLIFGGIAFFGTNSLNAAKNALVSLGKGATYSASKLYNRFAYNRLKLEKDPVKLKELLSEYLKSEVHRQDEALDKIVEIISGMADMWSNSDRTGVPCTSACAMTFIGDSGIGKSQTAKLLSAALFHKDIQSWQSISSTSVTAALKAHGGDSEFLSPADQLFNENSEIIRQLSLNNRVIIVLDEIDKIHKLDPNDTILERLRDARDTGKLLVRKGVNSEYVDVSRTVFICITNERRECWGLPEVELTEAQAAAGTTIKRDKSLVNRFDVVEFKYFKSEDYEFILRPQLNDIKEEYAREHGITVNISDELVKSISEAAEAKNKGERGINDYLVSLRGKLVDYRANHKELPENCEINLKYVAELGMFEIS